MLLAGWGYITKYNAEGLAGIVLMFISTFIPQWGVLKSGDPAKRIGDAIGGKPAMRKRYLTGLGARYAVAKLKDWFSGWFTYKGLLSDSNTGLIYYTKPTLGES